MNTSNILFKNKWKCGHCFFKLVCINNRNGRSYVLINLIQFVEVIAKVTYRSSVYERHAIIRYNVKVFKDRNVVEFDVDPEFFFQNDHVSSIRPKNGICRCYFVTLFKFIDKCYFKFNNFPSIEIFT